MLAPSEHHVVYDSPRSCQIQCAHDNSDTLLSITKKLTPCSCGWYMSCAMMLYDTRFEVLKIQNSITYLACAMKMGTPYNEVITLYHAAVEIFSVSRGKG